jgi:hypothetical protein
MLDQVHHGQQKMPATGQKSGQSLLVHFPLPAYRVVTSLHGVSSFMVSQSYSFRIRLNRRSTFDYGWDILPSWPVGEDERTIFKS